MNCQYIHVFLITILPFNSFPCPSYSTFVHTQSVFREGKKCALRCRVTVKNKTNYTASGQVVYSIVQCVYSTISENKELLYVDSGETWTSAIDRGAHLLKCVMTISDGVPIPLNMAEDYQSTGTSYAAFEIVFDSNSYHL